MKKIMFNDKYCLTQAVLDGTKTMTRRLLGNGIPLGNWEETAKHLPYKVGEVAAIAQSYKNIASNRDEAETVLDLYKIGNSLLTMDEMSAGWNNKMFVRADLMPHHIRFTDVKAERLQDISDEDCMSEGLKFRYTNMNFGNMLTREDYYYNYLDKRWRNKLLWNRISKENFLNIY